MGRLTTIHLSFTISRVFGLQLKLGCITNFDTLFLVMGLISLVYEIQYMLISNRHNNDNNDNNNNNNNDNVNNNNNECRDKNHQVHRRRLPPFLEWEELNWCALTQTLFYQTKNAFVTF